MFILSCFVLATSVRAFRLFDLMQWDKVTPEEPHIWLEFDEAFYNHRFSENAWEREGLENPLSGIPATDQMPEILRLVLEDFNQVSGSYLRLNFYRENGGPTPLLEGAEHDRDFDEEHDKKRLIKVEMKPDSGARTGYAQPITDAESRYHCRVVIHSLKEARTFKTTLTHEIGHCLGLAHAHNDRDAVMGYNTRRQIHSLGIDDKMGIVYLFPSKPEFRREVGTFGFGCAVSGAQ